VSSIEPMANSCLMVCVGEGAGIRTWAVPANEKQEMAMIGNSNFFIKMI